MGRDVENAAGESIGEVEDLILDMKSREVLAVVISSGGFLGVGDTLSAIPVTALQYEDKGKAFKTKLTKQQLGEAPQFKANAWPDYREPATMEELRTYRDSLDSGVTATGNTARNKDSATGTDPDDSTGSLSRLGRDANKDSVNRTDRDDRSEDVQMTEDIRSGIMDEDLPFKVKNIKIMTRDGNVTLKGVVESEDEREAILEIARDHADESKISDELKVESE
jgi:hypothetical protein